MPRVACLMMMKNEEQLIEPWLVYHGYMFGFENLYVWDNGSTSNEIKGILYKYENKGVNVDFSKNTKEDFHLKGVRLGDKISELDSENAYDFFLPLDCDEFLVLKATDDRIIRANKKLIHDAFNSLESERVVFEVNFNYPNILHEPKMFYGWAHQKRFFSQKSFNGMDKGFHNANIMDGISQKISPFGHIHYHFKPLDTMKQHSAEKLYQFIGENGDLNSVPKDNRVGRFLHMDEREYLEYLEKLRENKKYSAPEFFDVLSAGEVSIPFI